MLLKIYPDHPNRKDIDKVVNVLRDGGLVIYPTDTLYAIRRRAISRLFARICRPSANMHVSTTMFSN